MQALEAALPPTVGDLLAAAAAHAQAGLQHMFAARQLLRIAARCTVGNPCAPGPRNVVLLSCHAARLGDMWLDCEIFGFQLRYLVWQAALQYLTTSHLQRLTMRS